MHETIATAINDRERSENMIHTRKPINLQSSTYTRLT